MVTPPLARLHNLRTRIDIDFDHQLVGSLTPRVLSCGAINCDIAQGFTFFWHRCIHIASR
jgi:hypothetical protein